MASKVRVCARLRPSIGDEPIDTSVSIKDGVVSVSVPKDGTNKVTNFRLSSAYDDKTTQEDIFAQEVLPLLDDLLRGVTVTVFCYGVTSSGKTHTMQGTPEQPGIIPRTIEALFRAQDRMITSIESQEASFEMSFMEIYKDDAFDLLIPRNNALPTALEVRQKDGIVFVPNLSWMRITTADEFDRLYLTACKKRATGATNLNRASSRSHAILGVRITVRTHSIGVINLVDLAGSENNKHTGNDATRMAESVSINKSLSTLGQVVHALNTGQSRIPYRDSKLTRILQAALGGNSRTLLITNLAPGQKLRQDTLNTLNFATRAKDIENKPTANQQEARQIPIALGAPVAFMASHTLLAPPAPTGLSQPTIERRGSRRLSGIPLPKAHGRPSLSITPAIEPQASQVPQWTDEELNDRINKAVEAQVAKRLEEIERGRAEQRQSIELSAVEPTSQSDSSAEASTSVGEAALDTTEPLMTVPSGVLTPLLTKHQDLDNELHERLRELEKRLEGSKAEAAKPGSPSQLLSPVSRKKTGRAYVALARAHSDRGNLRLALEFYRKAETYVPDNVKLRERIIEIEWAVREGVPFIAEGAKKRKNKSNSRSAREQENEVEGDGNRSPSKGSKRKTRDVFGERINGGAAAAADDSDVEMATPAKRVKTGFEDARCDQRRRFAHAHAPSKHKGKR